MSAGVGATEERYSRGFETLVEEVSRNYEQVESRFGTAHWIAEAAPMDRKMHMLHMSVIQQYWNTKFIQKAAFALLLSIGLLFDDKKSGNFGRDGTKSPGMAPLGGGGGRAGYARPGQHSKGFRILRAALQTVIECIAYRSLCCP